MAQEVTIRPYQHGDEAGILGLFNAVFAEGNPTFEPRTPAHWNWQFRDNPQGHHTWVAIAPTGSMVGTYTAIPGTWLHDGAEMTGSQAVDTCVHRDYRSSLKREGLFLTLARKWFDEWGRPDRDRIVYGFPNPLAYRIGTKQLDYRPVHVPVISVVRDFAGQQDPWVDYLSGMGASRIDVRELTAAPPSAAIAPLFAAMAGPLRLVARRDAAYLAWRYLACPTHRYRLLAAYARGSDVLRGLLVMRTSWFDKPLAPLVDWVVPGSDVEAIAALAQQAARIACEAGKHRLESWVPPWSEHWDTLRSIGFAPDPSRFNLCIRVFGPPFDEAWAKDHWFFTMGDSDVY